MGIDAKDVGVFVWKILRFSTNTTCRYVRKYPVVSGVFTFVFLLYAFLPSVFYFLLCSSPLVAFAAFYLRNHLNLKPLTIGNTSKEKKTDNGSSSSVQKGSVSGDGKNQKAHLRPQRSVRRNARRKVEEVGKDWDSLQASEDETDRVILTTLYGELPSTITPDFEKFKKDKTLLVAQESLFDHVVDSSSSNTENVVLESFEKVTSGGGETEVESSSSEEEESHEERNKAVAWTEDDQKNLMDLGISEIARNKRLENLIARRRARRLFLLAAERSLRDMGIPQICVERNYFDLDLESYGIDGLQMPGSAPSVLLPTRNPFDIPYDPQEEKPNLSGDSFQQEFAAAGNQKEMFFSRHESFCRGIFPSENHQDSKLEPWRKVVDGQGFSRIKPQQDVGNNGHLVEQQQPLTEENDLTKAAEGNNMEPGSGHRSEVRIEVGSIRNDDSESCSSLSPRDSEKNFDVLNQTNSKTFCKRNGDHIGNSLVGLVPRNNVSSSLGAERQKYMEHFGYSTRRRHMVTHSVDSDLQVEFSDIGSPPTTVDENDSSDDEKLLSVYESKVGREMGFSGEETETKPKNTVDTSAKFEKLHVEEGDQDFTKMGLSSSPENNVTEKFEGPSDVTDVHGGSLEDDRPKPRELQGQSPSDSSNVIPLEISDRESDIVEEPEVPHPDEVVSKKVEESHKLSENAADEIKISYDSDEPEPSEKTDQESQGHGENNDEEQRALETQEVVETEVSDVDHGNSNESAPSPRSVLPDVLSLDQTYSLNSEDFENLSDGHPRTVNATPLSVQDQPGGGRTTEEPEEESGPSEKSTAETSTMENANLDTQETIQKRQEDSLVTVSEESKVATDIDDMDKLYNEKSKSTESNEELKPMKHETLDSSEQIIARDKPEVIRDIQEESKAVQELQFFVDSSAEEHKSGQSTVIQERTFAMNPEDERLVSEDRSQSGEEAPEPFQDQSADERNIEKPEGQCGPSEKSTKETDIIKNVNSDASGSTEKKHEGSAMSLSEKSKVDDPVIIKELYKDASKQIIARNEPETVRDVQEESKFAEGHDFLVNTSAEELKNDQTARMQEREDK